MKKILGVFLFLFMIITFTGCSLKKGSSSEPIKGECKVTECIERIGLKDTLEEVNEIMGFDGTLVKEEDDYTEYKWEVSKSSSVKVAFYKDGKNDISIKFNKEDVKNDKIDFSNFKEMKKLIQTGKMDYDTFKEKVGGIDGTLVQKSFYTKQYLWYNSSTKYFNATFSETTGMCTLLTGYNE